MMPCGPNQITGMGESEGQGEIAAQWVLPIALDFVLVWGACYGFQAYCMEWNYAGGVCMSSKDSLMTLKAA